MKTVINTAKEKMEKTCNVYQKEMIALRDEFQLPYTFPFEK